MATQVEMDEFLVLRRLNLEIQGFPESYLVEPDAMDDKVGAEPHSLPTGAGGGGGVPATKCRRNILTTLGRAPCRDRCHLIILRDHPLCPWQLVQMIQWML